MEQKVGISLCTRGAAVRIVGNRLCMVERGVAMAVTPTIPVIDIEASEDFEECIVSEDADIVDGETAPFFPELMSAVTTAAPCIMLDEGTTSRFVITARRIAEREALLPRQEILRRMNRRLMSLMRLQLIMEVLYVWVDSRPTVDECASRGEQVFVAFMQSLAQHYAERRPVAQYASEACLSVRHFSSLVQQLSGRTPMQWIHSYTISQAQRLLRQPGLQVKEVAERMGFPEQFTFRKYFKTHTGMSPTEFRLKR